MIFHGREQITWFPILLSIFSIIFTYGCSQNILVSPSPHWHSGSDLSMGPQIIPVTVSRHASVSWTDQDTAQILWNATNIAQRKDSPEDIPCRIAFVNAAPVAEFQNPATPAFVGSQYDFNTVMMDKAGGVKLVAGMDWCGGKFVPNVLGGCTPMFGPGMVVVGDLPFTPAEPVNEEMMKSVLWLHEFGHHVGLYHRDHEYAVMNPRLESYHTWFNSLECSG